ncbi:hypothetical protein BDZ94DRAFT_1271762 [Collybia nuda]|uniref:Serine/threonine-protein phosphatase 1 regulatory subunit 10 n=1 Tax=Collybia nuda TaxID=64659 RepID=A0A9P6CA39_9AGAR|nr:hypothetical protein BDZ94DRAFT_1271762 [Collybia nuda]
MENLYTQWVQQPQLLSDPSHQHETRPSATLADDWPKDRSTTTATTGAAGSPIAGGGTAMDISDFTTLGDMGGATTSTPSLSSPPQTFYTPYSNSYFVQSPYTMSYGSAWPGLPLSNYSSLNGATTSSSAGSSSQQQQQMQPTLQPKPQSQPQSQLSQSHQATPQPMLIDPALTTTNGSSSSNMQHYPQANYTAQSSQPQRNPYQYNQHIHQALPYTLPTTYFTSSHLQQQQPQGTLSPQALHSPSSALMGSLTPTSFYSQPPPVASTSQKPTITPQERKQRFRSSLEPLLVPSAFSGAQAVYTLVEKIADYGSQDVDAGTRLEILTKIRDGAGNHYFRAWAENATAIDITREWLKAAFTAKSDNSLVETIMPLLHIIDRLPMTIDSLKASKLGKIVVKLVKDPPTPAIKDMAGNVERKWRQLVSVANDGDDARPKKRKLNETAPAKPSAPPKKPAVGTASSTKPVVVKKEVKPVVTAVKDAKSDSSFFSTPKPKPKLPSFKKGAPVVQVKREPGTNVAQPSSVDPFQEVLKSMTRTRKDSPAASTPPSGAASTPPQSGITKNGKKKKSVTWAPESQLESIRLIEKAVYDDDPVDGPHTSHSYRELDRGEGNALHAHIFEETVDWAEPILMEVPIDIEIRPRGEGSEEKVTQEQREQTALTALYMSFAHIPDSPAEPSHVIPEEDVDKEVKIMTSGPEVDAIFWSGGPISPVSHVASVADLVGQLAVGNMDPAMGGASFNGQGLDLKAVGLDASATLSAVQALPQEQLQALLQQLSAPTMYPQGGQPAYNGTDQAWPTQAGFPTEYGQGFHDDAGWSSSDGRGRGGGRGRGRGRGRGDDAGGYRHIKRKPCSFFAAGRCKYGDQCDFAHENFS